MAARKETIRTKWDAVESGQLSTHCRKCGATLKFNGRNDGRDYLTCGCGAMTPLTSETKTAIASDELNRIERGMKLLAAQASKVD